MSNVAFELFAKLALDSSEYESGLNNAKSIASSVGGGIKTAFSIGAKAIGAATAAVGAFSLASVKSYAEYEQLVGGVDKLYGEASGKLQDYANEAYKTAGMSANTYMETATSFSAALIKSLGGDVSQAADMTDVAMRAISDNVNTFGSDMTSVTMAFQGFAKQNYTMLDNLKLGYGGTKSEMEKLIADANEYRASIGETSDLSIDSFADVVQAIQSIQEAQNIAGTTSKEAMKTIEGSAVATKAAWQNVITAIAGGGDLDGAFDQLITSIFGENEGEGFLNQIIPRIETTMEGIGTFIGKAAPFITQKLPVLVSAILPSALKSGVTLLTAIASGLIDSLPALLDTAKTIITTLGESFTENASEIEAVGSTILDMLLNAITVGIPQLLSDFAQFFANSFPTVIDRLTDVMVQLALAFSDPNMISSLIQSAVSIITTLAQSLLDNLPKFIQTAPKIIQGLIQGLVDALPSLIEGAIQILSGLTQYIIENLPLIIAAAFEIMFALASGLIEALPSLLMAGVQLVTSLVASLQAALPKFLANGMEITKAIVSGILSLLSSIAKAALDLINKFIQTVIAQKEKLFDNGKKIIEMVKDGIKEKIDDAKQWGQDLIENFINGIKEKWEALKTTVSQTAQAIWEYLHFSEPEKGPLSDFHTYAPDMMNLFMQGIEDNKAKLLDTVANAFNFGDMIVSPSASVETAGVSGGFTQINNIYSPEELSPSEVARQTRNATRDMLLELRGL